MMSLDDELSAADRDDEPPCDLCGGDTEWVRCEQCNGDGVDGHECGEDTCACLHPEDNRECDVCEGAGGWLACVARCER